MCLKTSCHGLGFKCCIWRNHNVSVEMFGYDAQHCVWWKPNTGGGSMIRAHIVLRRLGFLAVAKSTMNSVYCVLLFSLLIKDKVLHMSIARPYNMNFCRPRMNFSDQMIRNRLHEGALRVLLSQCSQSCTVDLDWHLQYNSWIGRAPRKTRSMKTDMRGRGEPYAACTPTCTLV